MKKITIILSSIIFIVITITFLAPIQSAIHNASYREETVVIDDESFTLLSYGGNTNGLLTSESRIFSWGTNTLYQVGNNDTTAVKVPTNISAFYTLNAGEVITQVSYGGDTNGFLTSENRIFSWGRNSNGSVGNNDTTTVQVPTDISTFYTLNEGETITQISYGGSTNGFLTSENRIFSWGVNTYGAVGNNDTTAVQVPTDISTFYTLNEDEVITQISYGATTNSFLTSDNRIFSWGRNDAYQVGNNDTVNVLIPTDISSFYTLNEGETITQISYGNYTNGFLTSENRIFSWGANSDYQVGNNDTVAVQVPTDISSFYTLNEGEVITQISYGGATNGFLTSEKRIFSWGRNTTGSVGNNDTADVQVPTDISTFYTLNTGEVITQISYGGDSNGFITDKTRIFSWGANNVGQVGNNDTTAVQVPTDITTFLDSVLNEGYTTTIEVERNSTITRLLTVLPLIIVGAVVVLTVTIGFKKEN